MVKKYYKTDSPEILSAHEEMEASTQKLVDDSKAFAAQFDAKNLMSTQMTGRRFGGLVLNNYQPDMFDKPAPIRKDKHLWTTPNSNQISWPRKSIDVKKFKAGLTLEGITDEAVIKAKVKEAKEELAKLCENYSKGERELKDVSFDPFFKSFGTDWGNLMFSGLRWFKVGGFIYFETGANFGDRMTEIVGSEFEAAEKEVK